MHFKLSLGLSACVSLALTACGGGGGSPNPSAASTKAGTLIKSSLTRVASFNPADLAAQLNANPQGQQILASAGTPSCGVDFHYYQYQTAGGQSEQTTASGALMVPTGGAGCGGARPILVYTHGTAVSKAFNLANINDPTNDAWPESAIVAAFYAAHGYIVVASNYAGYDSSPLPYHPYLDADQQSKDVINALTAARAALASGLPAGVSDNGKLFITGYSEGGHVAMATHRAMEALGMPVTASAPMSGPYAMLAFGDAVFTYSNVGLGGSIYYPMVINSYQHAYGNIYNSPTDIYSPEYASGIDSLLPGPYTYATVFASGKLPELAIFNSTTPGTGTEPGTGIPALDRAMKAPNPAVNPIGALGFGQHYLFNNSFRIAYALDSVATPDGAVPKPSDLLPPAQNPASPMRMALKKNDLRGWTPKAPVMLCGGMNDPDVFYQVNTLTMKALWASQVSSGQVHVVDVDPFSNGNADNAGQTATVIGSIAAGVYASESTAAVSQIGNDVQHAIIANGAFKSFFDASGAPNSPQGVMVLGMAGVAAQAVSSYLAQGGTSPTDLAATVGGALMENYHFPLTQTACEVAAQAYFAGF